MTQLWTIINAAGEVVQPCCSTADIDTPPDACGEPWAEGYEAIPIDAAPDLNQMAWSGTGWEADVHCVRAIRWEEAKEVYVARIGAGFALDGIGRVQTNAESREAIYNLADEAREKIAAGEAWSTGFKNEANVYVTVTAEQIVAVYRELRAFLGECWSVKEAIGAALASAVTAEQILAIDVTAGYPA